MIWRRLGWLLVGLLACSPAWAFTVTSAGSRSLNNVATNMAVTWNVGAGSTVIVCVRDASLATTSAALSDTVNTYTLINTIGLNNATGTNGFLGIWYAQNATAVSGGTLTYTSGTSGGTRSVALSGAYVTGGASSSPIDTAVTTFAAGTGTSASVTSGAASAASELFIGCVGNNNSGNTQSSGFATPPNSSGATGAQISGGNETNAGSGALTYTSTITSGVWAAGIVAIALPATATRLLLMGVGN